MTTRAIQDEWLERASLCWGCGRNNPQGLHLKSYWNDDETVATFVPDEHHLAFPGILNGGIITTIIDCHCTGTANAFAHKNEGSKHIIHVTASISVRFHKPTPVDKPVTLRARVKESDGHKTIVTCSLYSGDCECATGEVLTVGVALDDFVKRESPNFKQ
ncbi:MAG: PaaI family thioesterase [Promethearchaeota archaeon]